MSFTCFFSVVNNNWYFIEMFVTSRSSSKCLRIHETRTYIPYIKNFVPICTNTSISKHTKSQIENLLLENSTSILISLEIIYISILFENLQNLQSYDKMIQRLPHLNID